MSELHPELAKATAQTALQFLAAFNGEDWGILRQDNPGPNDRRHLAIALDYIQELGAMVLNLADRVAPASLPAAEDARDGSFQSRVQPWMMACFGAEISSDRKERNHRHLEEALELVQSCGCTQSEAHQLVDYVYGRPVGEPYQEVGGVMVTLAALCLANGLDMHDCGEKELARIWTKVEQIRAKQAAKPKHSPLPAAPAMSQDSKESNRG